MTVGSRGPVERALYAARTLVSRAQSDPISSMQWLPLQWAFLADPYPLKVIRSGNQTIGKTTASLALTIGHCVGRHPLGDEGYDIRPPPVDWWLVLQSFGAVDQQRKLWDLLPKEELDPRTEFDVVRGFRPVNEPAVVFRNGSILRIKTANQDAIDFASATLDGVTWDEPPTRQRVFTESLQRIEERGGYCFLSFTPVNAPTGYLRELCEAGTLHDHWVPLTPDQLIPVGGVEPLRTRDGRLKDAAWIAEREALVPSHERPVVIHGEWEMRSVDRYFEHFRDGGGDSHVHTRVPECEVDIVIGIDHGSRPGKQIAVLVLVWRDEPSAPWRIYVLDEYTDRTGRATPRDDAIGVLDMLRRHRLRWRDLSFVGGDKVHEPGLPSQKSNKDLAVQIARELGRRGELAASADLHPPIRTIKRGTGRGAGSVSQRARWLYHRTLEPGGCGVHPRCARVRGAIAKYDLRDNEFKDPIDAIGYAVDPWVFEGGLPSAPIDVRLG